MRAAHALPPAIESAQLLSGVTYRLGGFSCPLLSTPSPQSRARLLSAMVHDDVIICGLSAAWVWGSLRELTHPLEFAVLPTSRVSVGCGEPHSRHEYQFTAEEVTTLLGKRITTPARTAFDLLRNAVKLNVCERVACRLLLFSLNGEGRAQVEQMLRSRKRMPNTSLVRKRLALLYDAD